LNVPHAAQKGRGFRVAEIFERLGKGVFTPALRVGIANLLEQPVEYFEKIRYEGLKLKFSRDRGRLGNDYVHAIAKRLAQYCDCSFRGAKRPQRA